MPELPEVETVRRGLEQKLVGQIIVTVELPWQGSFLVDPAIPRSERSFARAQDDSEIKPKIIKKLMVRQKIDSISRRGKVLIINLSNEHTLLIQIGRAHV